MMPGRTLFALIMSLAGLGLLASLACGGGASSSDPEGSQPPTAPNDGTTLSSVAPDTFLTYEGRSYRLVDLEQAGLVDESEFEPIGTASQADVNQADLTVYRRSGDDEAVYTFAPEAGSAEDGEEASTPALWYRWHLEP